ncbi:MAG: alanine--tRNA ligase [Candidatus Roizmanbacteria bacterium]|nr:alanine--tRNA ligase [Candidatus Roizmanbacteria bacterium]
MTSEEILQRYIRFYVKRGHAIIPNISLVPENDPSLLFVNSGMFPLVPYLSGEPHPLGNRLVSIQRAVRFFDLEEVGDNRHTTVFHMIGNWSLGDYFKQEQLPWIYEFFIEELGLDPYRLFATVFEGDKDSPRDTESITIIKKVFKKYGIEARENERIFAYGKDGNWWQRGDAIGELGGTDSEIFYYIGKVGQEKGKNPKDNEDDFLEIGNSVFLQFKRIKDGWEELSQKNVDFGGGFERIAMVIQNKNDIFETDNFWPLIQRIQDASGIRYLESKKVTTSMRVLADHIRAATFLAMDGVIASNKDQGYVLRRYLRRIVRFGRNLKITHDVSVQLVQTVADMFSWMYSGLPAQVASIQKMFALEEAKFATVLDQSEKQLQKMFQDGNIPKDEITASQIAFDLYQSIGTPPEMTQEFFQEQNVLSTAQVKKFHVLYDEKIKEHQTLSRKGAEAKFKGGLADHSEQVVQYHTTTHLLHEALRRTLGTHVQQYGSNITKDRLRFDFSHTDKLTDKQLLQTEQLINTTIAQVLPVQFVMMPKEKAEKSGALHFFKEKYTDTVKVYFIGNDIDHAFSKEFCGGPHISNLSELPPKLHIYKQESVGKGIRRIYARFE